MTVFEAKKVVTGRKRKREPKGDPGDVDGYMGPWRGYVDQEKVSRPTDEQKAVLELMFAEKKKDKKEEEETVAESTLLHGRSWRMQACTISLMATPSIWGGVKTQIYILILHVLEKTSHLAVYQLMMMSHIEDVANERSYKTISLI